MATPFVEFQATVYITLTRLLGDRPHVIRRLVAECRENPKRRLPMKDFQILSKFGLCVALSDWMIDALPEILLQQIDDSGPEIRIRNILGMELRSANDRTLSIAEYSEAKGLGINRLRTGRFAQPGALKVGDILASGCRVISEPREGGDGSILIQLARGRDGVWIDVPARIPIALLTEEDQAPAGYVK